MFVNSSHNIGELMDLDGGAGGFEVTAFWKNEAERLPPFEAY
jgi:predicted flavoprotein YhiN